jgi:hypothetical protein
VRHVMIQSLLDFPMWYFSRPHPVPCEGLDSFEPHPRPLCMTKLLSIVIVIDNQFIILVFTSSSGHAELRRPQYMMSWN